MVVLYIFLFLLANFFLDFDTISKSANIRALNRMKPSSESYLADFVKGRTPFNKRELELYQDYYKRITQVMPQRSAANGMLGFSLYHLGKHKKAIKSYQKAIALSPHFFWYYYNLGIIYYENDNYQNSKEMFKRAIASDRKLTKKNILSSWKIHLGNILKMEGIEGDPVNRQMKVGYKNAHIMLMLSLYHLKNYDDMLKQAKKAIVIDSLQDKRLLYYVGVASYHLKLYDKALKFFSMCMEKDKNYAEALYYLGLSLEKSGQKNLGMKAMQGGALLQKQFGSQKALEADISLQIF